MIVAFFLTVLAVGAVAAVVIPSAAAVYAAVRAVDLWRGRRLDRSGGTR